MNLENLKTYDDNSIEVHSAPENLEQLSPEEAYGIGYYKGKDVQCDHPDWSAACVKNDNSNLSNKFEQEASAKSAALASASTLANSLKGSGVYVDDWLLSRVYTALLRISRLIQGRTISGNYKKALSAFDIHENNKNNKGLNKMKITRQQLKELIKEAMYNNNNYDYLVESESGYSMFQNDVNDFLDSAGYEPAVWYYWGDEDTLITLGGESDAKEISNRLAIASDNELLPNMNPSPFELEDGNWAVKLRAQMMQDRF